MSGIHLAVLSSGGGRVVSGFGGELSTTSTLPDSSTAGLTINPDGSFTVTIFTGFDLDTITGDVWFQPLSGGAGNSYWVRVTVTSGTLSSGTAGSWLSLSTARTWTRSRSTVGTSSVTFTLEIASDSGGSNILASGTFTLTATVNN